MKTCVVCHSKSSLEMSNTVFSHGKVLGWTDLGQILGSGGDF